MKVIMVPVADRPECRIALEAAFGLAADLSANIVGYHLRPHREEPRPNRGPHVPLAVAEAELPEPDAKQIDLNSASAERLFRETAEKHGIAMARKPRDAAQPLAFWNVYMLTYLKMSYFQVALFGGVPFNQVKTQRSLFVQQVEQYDIVGSIRRDFAQNIVNHLPVRVDHCQSVAGTNILLDEITAETEKLLE